MSIGYREATADDADAIGRLHADSWRRNYRGAMRDSYLDGDVVTERLATWTERLASPAAGSFTVVAVREGAVVGFAHTVVDADPEWGALLDNLHVTHELRGHGIGGRHMTETARRLVERTADPRLHLWVLEQNTAAQDFYVKRGGLNVERTPGDPLPDGGSAPAFRFAWPDVTTLLGGTP